MMMVADLSSSAQGMHTSTKSWLMDTTSGKGWICGILVAVHRMRWELMAMVMARRKRGISTSTARRLLRNTTTRRQRKRRVTGGAQTQRWRMIVS
jgi:ActR/RegA family two-component response regulator